jgi:hypothetical protein
MLHETKYNSRLTIQPSHSNKISYFGMICIDQGNDIVL